jgi:hypothetical protein
VPYTQLLTVAVVAGLPLTTASVAWASDEQGPAQPEVATRAENGGVAEVSPEPATPRGGVSDDVWSALEGKQVVIETSGGPVEGELASVRGDTLVIIASDGSVSSVPKSQATTVRVAKATAKPASSMPTTPPPATSDGAAPDGAADDADDDGEQSRKDKRRERREERSYALLGTFSAHGVAYAHWRGDGVQAGHAAYAMDWGVGFNATESFGMYAMAGGLLGARIDDKQIRANYGHVAFMFAFARGKYFQTMFGAGAAFNRLRFADDTLQKDVGLAVPMKMMGKIPLPHKIYLGIGLSYELGLVRNFGRVVNGIGGQIVIGRW